MEWLLTMSAYWTAFSGSYTCPDPRYTMITTSPTDLDLRLIRLAYEVAAGESSCARCGAPIGRRLRLATSYAAQSPTWRVLVATRCRGWRRHRQAAVVTEAFDHLQLGPLLPT